MRGEPKFDIGDRVSGTEWVVQAKLGERGSGVMYGVVRDSGVQGAMKVMLPAAARVPGLVARFLHEARLLARLKHPNIVRIIDFDQLADGTPFVVMERLQGRTLRKALRAVRDNGGLTTSLAYEIIRQLCEGLHCAHSHDPPIVHRDVRPDNIFVHQASGDTVLIKLIDFGIAAMIDGGEGVKALGTPIYMAPELLLGEPASPQSDIYSVALLLYQMLTDHFPWDVDIQTTMAVADAHLKLAPVPPSRYASWIPAAVDECVMQALAKDPKARPQSVHDFCASLCVLQFVDDSLKSAIDIDATPTNRHRDLMELAALAGVTDGPIRVAPAGAEPRPSPVAKLEAAPHGGRRRRVVTGMLVATLLLGGTVGAAVLARHATGAPAAAASSALNEFIRPAAGIVRTGRDPMEALPPRSVSVFAWRSGDASPSRADPRMRSEPKPSGGTPEAALAASSPSSLSSSSVSPPMPTENDDIHFLPDQP